MFVLFSASGTKDVDGAGLMSVTVSVFADSPHQVRHNSLKESLKV